MISVFISQYPNYKSYKTNKITPGTYSRYHIQNYLQETYIFKERLERLVKIFEKTCKKQNIDKKTEIEKIRTIIKSTLDSVVQIRGAHVHQKNYDNDDLLRLSLFELLDLSGEIKKDALIINRLIYKQDRQKWKKDIHSSAQNLTELLDSVLKILKPILFNDIKKSIK
jgi:uncharacterized protein YktB (UPF0637 family)